MRDVEVVGLRARRRRRARRARRAPWSLRLRPRRGRRSRRRSSQPRPRCRRSCRRRSARTGRCASRVRRAGRRDRARTSPLLVDPDGEARGLEELDRPRHERVRDRALLDDVDLRLDDEAAVEAGQRRTQRERLDEHLHPPRRPPARQRRSGCPRRAARARPRRCAAPAPSWRDERPVDVREQELDHFMAR